VAKVASDYVLILLAALGLLSSQLLLKEGTRYTGAISLNTIDDFLSLLRQILTTPLLIAGYGVSAITAVFWLVVVSRLDLSLAVPLLSATYYVLLLLTSSILLGEAVTVWRWTGTLLIVAGIVLLSYR
jgi:multidrug transporter EmrE-like cation transporter